MCSTYSDTTGKDNSGDVGASTSVAHANKSPLSDFLLALVWSPRIIGIEHSIGSHDVANSYLVAALVLSVMNVGDVAFVLNAHLVGVHPVGSFCEDVVHAEVVVCIHCGLLLDIGVFLVLHPGYEVVDHDIVWEGITSSTMFLFERCLCNLPALVVTSDEMVTCDANVIHENEMLIAAVYEVLVANF